MIEIEIDMSCYNLEIPSSLAECAILQLVKSAVKITHLLANKELLLAI
jgi:hypothetical protein